MDYKNLDKLVGAQLAASGEAKEGFRLIAKEGERRGFDLQKLSYVLATSFWETARSMQPVREAYYLGSFKKAEAWRKKNLSYYPYYGRGYVQLTHKSNYKKAGSFLGIDLENDPDLALKEEYAVPIIFQGMEMGWFTGKKLDDYIDGEPESEVEDLREYREARRIVNGTNKADTIAILAAKIDKILQDCNYDVGASTTSVTSMTSSLPNDFSNHIESLGLRYFKPYEFLTKGGKNSNSGSPAFGLNTDPPKGKWSSIDKTARVLDELRHNLKLPIVFTSVYRSPAYNTAIGGASDSRHMYFDAVDFVVKGSTVGPIEWANVLRSMRSANVFKGGIGVYSSFVHVDTRGHNADW